MRERSPRSPGKVSALPLKIAGALAVALSGLLFGRFRARRLAVRRDFLKELLVFLSALSTSLRYKSDDIFRLVSSSGELFSAISNYSGESFENAWKNVIGDFRSRYSLSAQDQSLLCEFGAQLGKTDTEGQLSHIELYQALFSKQLALAEEDVKSKSKLYQTMGLFAGVSAAIVLV